jgi:beta-galactosidase
MRAVLLPCLLFLSFLSFSQVHSFGFRKNDFLLDGKPFRIISGEMHPARIPKEYWRHRIRMAKAMGCNTIAVYVFWNYLETKEDNFDFRSENRDVATFIRICKEEGLWVLLRPGPYVCAEWDFGGLPPYLLKIPDIKIRCMDSRYISAVARYIRHLAAEVRPLQCTKGGPILMLQIENEYGSYGNDKAYLSSLKALWLQNGIEIPFYTADGPTQFMLEAGSVKGAAIGLDSGSSEADFEEAFRFNPDVPAFSSETYPGWLTHWGEKFARPDTLDLKKEVSFLLKNNKSFNLYVIHGGTNFGLSAGANSFSPTQYQPDITSYDYDAPIDEQGNPTAKYFMLRRLISEYVDQPLPDPPPPVPTIEIPEFSTSTHHSIWDVIANTKAIHSPQPLPFESLGQNQGFVLYRTRLVGHKGGKLTIHDPHDYALVFLNHKFIDTVYRDGGKWTVDLPVSNTSDTPILEILVEGMGHINFAQYMIDRKGITDRVTLDGMTLMDWEIFPIPIDNKFFKGTISKTAGEHDALRGQFYSANVNLTRTGDTFFDLSNFKKGYVEVNGHLLGRYWNIGPQQKLYCPASWLKRGANEIIIFDLHQLTATSLKATSTPY